MRTPRGYFSRKDSSKPPKPPTSTGPGMPPKQGIYAPMSDDERAGVIPPRCDAAWSPEWTCKREPGHDGQHIDRHNGPWFYGDMAPRREPARLIRAVEQHDGSIIVYVKPYAGHGEVPELILSVVGGTDA